MPRRNYPLNALRMFEASARNLSFAKASEELSVTPAAVSQQVKVLEEFLDQPLFRRQPKGLLLTETGQMLMTELTEVFLRLDAAMDRVSDKDAQRPLTISVAPTFAALWLIPRLGELYEQHPGLDVRMTTGLGLADFQRDDYDAAIRLGKGGWPGLEEIKIMEEFVTPMCSQQLLEGSNAIKHPNDLQHHVLLHNHSMDYDPEAPTWRSWLQEAGATEVDDLKGTHFSLPDHGLQAAIDGAGIVLGWRNLAAKEVAAGRLVEPFDLSLPLGSTFYLVYPEAYSRRPNIILFRNWLTQALRGDGAT